MNFVYNLFTVTSLAAVLIWLGKFIINKSFDAGIERYKSDLMMALEQHKTNLAQMAMEHQIKFSKLHEQRAEVIKRLFSKVIDLEGALINSTTPAQGPDYINDTNRDADARKILVELINDFDHERIYFSNHSVAKFEAIIKESWDIVSQMVKVRRDGKEVAKYIDRNMPVPESYIRYDDLWSTAFDRATRDFRVFKEDLANEFRGLIGIIP